LFRKTPPKAQNDYIFYKFGGWHGPSPGYAYALALPSEIFCARHCLVYIHLSRLQLFCAWWAEGTNRCECKV